MKSFLSVFLCLFAILFSHAQNITGKVYDDSSGDPLIGATVTLNDEYGAITNLDGEFSINSENGEFHIEVSYVGFEPKSQIVNIKNESLFIEFRLNSIQLNEVNVVADVARDRHTPVAFSTIPIKKIAEELASQDVPMILNSTPGVYATQSGGGDGDARITIRGFNQRNVAVMIDGIPVNDMENGWVYWSNWFGLDAVTSNIQVQRGLGASKIAIPSVGGTMNILTKGISNKEEFKIKQEIGSFGKLRTSIGYNSGKLKRGWGYTLATSYKRGNGFVDETWTEGLFYYTKIQKELGKHTLSVSAMGAPQKHGQRSYKSDIATYDAKYAKEQGIQDSNFGEFNNLGIKYNKHWGYLNRWTVDNEGDTLHSNSTLNTKQNYYHKPQFSIRDFWAVNDKLYISNIIYASIGHGGGTGLSGNYDNYDSNGQYNLQSVYDANRDSINTNYSNDLTIADTYIRAGINNHYWYGILSTTNYQFSEEWTFSGGIDLRSYKGEHYREVYDLLGADYIVEEGENELQTSQIKTTGDIVGFHNDGLVKWSGVFAQAEYSNNKLSTFFNISGSNSAYKRIDYFKKMNLLIGDVLIEDILGTSVATIYNYNVDGTETSSLQYEEELAPFLTSITKETVIDTVYYNGNAYTIFSPEAQHSQTDWKWIRGYTFKGGANYNIDDKQNVFFNTGYISKAPRFNNVYDYNNELWGDIRNEIVKAVEGGYSYRSPYFSANINTYYTIWENKPVNSGISLEDDDGNRIKGNINGIDALHKGVELDFAVPINRKLTLEGLLSYGDWRWTSEETILYYDDSGNPYIDPNTNEQATAYFDATGVYVGDAAQTQVGSSIRFEPSSKTYIKLRGTYFDRYYADFDPSSLNEENARTQSWPIPSYQIFDLHCGHTFSTFQNSKLNLRLSILNLFNEIYISDAQNNDGWNANYSDFDAKSAGVFFGLGRRINLSVQLKF